MRTIFVLENHGQYCIFAPLQGLIMEINAEEKSLLQNLPAKELATGTLTKIFPDIDTSQLQQIPEETEKNGSESFFPTSLTLFTTFDCRLKCSYCYSEAGQKKTTMGKSLARSAIDLVTQNAKQLGSKCTLSLHGGGEPTFNWGTFVDALEYFQERCRGFDLESEVSVATNGMLSISQINWIVEHLTSIQVSIDGPEDIQDQQRPTKNGTGSFDMVSRSIDKLLSLGIDVVLHSVVTNRGVKRIPELVGFLANRFRGIKAIHIEPVFTCGRALTSGEHFPSVKSFVDGFVGALEITRALDVELYYSGAGSDVTMYKESFCGATTPNFVVTPEGLITACNEVSSHEHDESDKFIYGSFNRATNQFEFDQKKFDVLRQLTKQNRASSLCKNCFARFYCAGDCLVKHQHTGGRNAFKSPRCIINRGLLKHFIFQKLNTPE